MNIRKGNDLIVMNACEGGAAPLVSIIVPVYNVLPYLRQALDSAVSQTYCNLEILVVNDGSTDGSEEICDEYAVCDPRVRVVHQENRGLSAARNAGIDLATGDYLLFLDSDDWLELDAVEILMREAVTTGADVVCCQHLREERNRTTSPHATTRRVFTGTEAVEAHVCGGGASSFAWGKLYHTGVVEGVRYPEGMVFEDVSTTWRFLDRASCVVILPQSLWHYRRRTGSISRNRDMENLVDYWHAYKGRYDALARRSCDMRRSLTEQCVLAIARTWSWCFARPKNERDSHASELSEMASFARSHTTEVLFGRYSARTKALCVMGRWDSPIAWGILYAANTIRMVLKREHLYT